MTPSYYYAMTGGNSVPPLWFVQNAPTNPYRAAADTLVAAIARATNERRPFAERHTLAAAEALCRRLADQTREEQK